MLLTGVKVVWLLAALPGCDDERGRPGSGGPSMNGNGQTPAASDEAYARRRGEMVDAIAPSIGDPRVLEAMRKVPRHLFVPREFRDRSYSDVPLPIGEGQTISQPTIVAILSELLNLDGTEKVLEVVTGSGYHAAVLTELAREVYTVPLPMRLRP
jgi:protein-L-isoaspartate(D-aspartate) O-methyltransferase